MVLKHSHSHDSCHSHQHHHHHHDHSHNEKTNNRSCSKTVRLIIMIILIFSFFLAELIVGNITHSIALIADSFHMLSDFVALCIALLSVWVCLYFKSIFFNLINCNY